MSQSLQEKRYDELVGLCYECILDDSVWPVLLDKLLIASGRQQGMLTLWESGEGLRASSIYRCDPVSIAAYNDYYSRLDLTPKYMNLDLNGIWYHDDQSIDARVRATHPYYQEFLYFFGHAGLSCLKLNGTTDDGVGSYLTILPNSDARPPTAAKQRLLQRLAPHLLRAARLSNHVKALSHGIQQRNILLDNSPTPVWLTDSEGHLLHCNRAAEAVLRSPVRPLVVKGQRLCRPSQDNALRALLSRAASPGHAGILPLEKGGEQQLLATPVAAHAPCNATFQRPLVMLTLLQKPRASILVQLFKLSPAENRLAELLAQGLKPDECADALCVSINTVRSQLRAIFQKTGTSRQSELIGLIHRLAVLVPASQDHPDL